MATDSAPAQGMAQSTQAPASAVKGKIEIDIVGPLSFWVIILVIGIILAITLPIIQAVGNQTVTNLIADLSNWILYLPGAVILPLIVSVWIGERVGASRNKVGSAVSVGIINAAYTALIYAIAIFVIYLLIKYILPPTAFLNKSVTLLSFVEFAVVLPIVIVIVLVPFIAALSAARHSEM